MTLNVAWQECRRSFFVFENWDLWESLRGCLVCIFKQQFSVFKQHFTHFNTFFHPHVFPQIFSNNIFQFLNTHTKRALKVRTSVCLELCMWVSVKNCFDWEKKPLFQGTNSLGLKWGWGLWYYASFWSVEARPNGKRFCHS